MYRYGSSPDLLPVCYSTASLVGRPPVVASTAVVQYSTVVLGCECGSVGSHQRRAGVSEEEAGSVRNRDVSGQMERAVESLSVQHEATELVQSEVVEVRHCLLLFLAGHAARQSKSLSG